MALPKRSIDIRGHAFHRAWERLRLNKEKATAAIRGILRRGTWYESPQTPGEYLVVGRVQNKPTCAIAKAEQGSVVVTTVFPLRNTARVRAYQQHGPGISAAEIAQRHQLSR